MTAWCVDMETERFTVFDVGGRKLGYEKPARVLGADDRVLVARLGDDVARSTAEALDKLSAGEVWERFRKVGIKVNLCGGVVGCHATFTDPLVVEGVIEHVRSFGAEPFVCEGDMRGLAVDEGLISRRGELSEVLARTRTPFVNLSRLPVPFVCHGFEGNPTFPEELLDPETAVVSVAAPKDHWECGISMAQKNMYGAISERRKALYHRGWSRIDRAVAAAARILRPDMAIVGGRWAGAGWGPHFCVPIEWHRVVLGTDALRVDGCMAEIYGFPYNKIRYAVINARGEEVSFKMVEGSADWPAESVRKLRRFAMTHRRRLIWKALLYPQYFLPHRFQHKTAPRLENGAAWFHHRFVDPLAGK